MRALKKDKDSRKVLKHLSRHYPNGEKSTFNKPGYLADAINLFPEKSHSEAISLVESYIKIFQELRIIEISPKEDQIKVKGYPR